MTPSFYIRSSVDHGVAHVHLSGEVDLAVRAAIRDHVNDHLHDDQVSTVVIDLSDITFLDSSGIGALVGCRRQADEVGKTLRAFGASGHVKSVLDITGVTDLLD